MVAGAMFVFHGLQKTFGFLADHPAAFGTQIWVGGIIELAAGALIALGLKTRWAAFLASGQMAVAYFQFHWRFQMDANFFPTLNHGELAALYCFGSSSSRPRATASGAGEPRRKKEGLNSLDPGLLGVAIPPNPRGVVAREGFLLRFALRHSHGGMDRTPPKPPSSLPGLALRLSERSSRGAYRTKCQANPARTMSRFRSSPPRRTTATVRP
jgi:putative oxidoreductase